MIAKTSLALATILAVSAAPALARPGGITPANVIAQSKPFQAARASLDGKYDLFVEQLVALTAIPAPPYKEADAAKVYADHFRALVLKVVTRCGEGQVTALRPSSDPAAGATLPMAPLHTAIHSRPPVT